MQLTRGMRDKLEKYINTSLPFEAEMSVSGRSVYDFTCFGVDENGKLSDDRYMIFYNQTASPEGALTYKSAGTSAVFCTDLSRLPKSIAKLVFTASIDGSGTMGDISAHSFKIIQNGSTALELNVTGADFSKEKAVITAELYFKDSWRINVIARGFNGGLSDLLSHYGGEEIKPSQPAPAPAPAPAPVPAPTPAPAPAQKAEPVLPAKINLKKGEKISLVKKENGLGEIHINLNWTKSTGLFSRPIDLDLGCLYELKDGRKGTVQALGKAFGSLDNPPYIALDGDDRSGDSANGENLRINGKMVPQIKRILIYTFIYEGIANWKGANGVVTVKCPGSPEITVNMDEYGSRQGFCVIALMENVNDTLSVEKIVQFYNGHREADKAFNWGLRWTTGRKD